MNPAELRGRKLHCDLNVPYHAEDKLTDRLKFIAKLGWDAVAITTLVKSGEQIPPPPPEVKETHGLKVYSRVTIIIETQMDKYNVRSGKSSANLGKYDVVCLIPSEEKLFADCCKEIECDLIGFSEANQFDARRGSVLAALARNIQFELNYSDWLRDSGLRKRGIGLAYRLGEMTRYKGLVFNSNCRTTSEIRSPSDAAFLLSLAKYKENAIPATTFKNSTIALVHAYGRKMGKCAIILKRKSENQETPVAEKSTKMET